MLVTNFYYGSETVFYLEFRSASDVASKISKILSGVYIPDYERYAFDEEKIFDVEHPNVSFSKIVSIAV